MPDRRKIKICAITTISKTMDWFLVESLRNLTLNGYDVTMICDMEPGFAERNQDFAKCIHLSMSRGANIKDLLKIPLTLRRIFKEEQFDAIYFTSPNASLYAAIAGKLAGINKRIYSQCGLRYVSFTGIKRTIFRLVEKITCTFSTHIRAQSPLNMRFAIDEKLCNPNKISVVGIGGTTGVSLKECDSFDHSQVRDQLRQKYGIPEHVFLFGYVGRINADKGINELITAFTKLSTKYDTIALVLVGMLDNANPIDEKNLSIAKEHKSIFMTGNIPSAEVYPHMAMFDVLTHPTYREGFGKVLQEAMGMRLPIITTNVPGPSEVIEDGISGILVNVMDSEDLAEKMEQIYHNATQRSELSSAGRKRAETYFDRPIMLNNILKDMNSILKQ